MIRIPSLVCVFALSVFSVFVGAAEGGPELRQLAGVYRGIAPTDESALVLGELELTLTPDQMVWRMATGLKVEEERLSLAGFEPMTRDEIATVYQPGSPLVDRSFGFKSPREHPYLVFLKDPLTDPADPGRTEFGLVVITGGMADMLGTTALFTPHQLALQSCDDFLAAIERSVDAGGKRVIPRLSTGGRVGE